MDLEISENFTENATFDRNEQFSLLYPGIYVEIPTAIVGTLATISNLLIILTIIKFHIMHTRSKFYLLNWCLCNSVITGSLPVMLNVFGLARMIGGKTLCIWSEITFISLAGSSIFVGILIIDWYITTFIEQSNCVINCRKSYKLIISTVWLFLSMYLVECTLGCLGFYTYHLADYGLFLCNLTVLAIIFLVIVMRHIKLNVSNIVVEKSNLEFKLAASYFLCWLPNVIFFYCFLVFSYKVPNYFFLSVEYLSYWFGFGNSCVLLILLYMYDKNFKACLATLLHVRFRQTNDEVNNETQDTLSIITSLNID